MSYVLNNYNDTYMGSIILEEAQETSVLNIIEESNKTEDMIISQEKGPNRLIAEIQLQDADRENRNKRWYAISDLRKEIYGDRVTELVKAKSFKGEAGHPLSDSVVRQQTIDPKLVCINHIKVWIDKDTVKAHTKGTNNSYGKEFDDDLRSGESPAVSLRALGSIENVDGKPYVKHLRIITYDKIKSVA